MQQKHRLSRVFRGAWRETSARVFHLSHVPDLVRLILRTSLARVGMATVRQVRGASMGNPCAPALCGAAAALWEVSFYEHCCIRQPQASVVRDLRYVDNRFVHHIAGDDLHWPWRFLFHPFFYRPPLLLDHVDSEDVMGSRINHSNHSIFMKVPTETDSFRSTTSATVLSGFQARALLAFRFTRPRSAIQDTIQQLQAQHLRAGLPRELLLSETRLHFRQQDISGFFNSVEHDCIIFGIERLLQRLVQEQRLPADYRPGAAETSTFSCVPRSVA